MIDVKGRLLNAGIMLVAMLIIVMPIWFASVGLYALGLWPLGAIIRVGDWAIALFFLYWIVHHLRGSPAERLMRQMRERGVID